MRGHYRLVSVAWLVLISGCGNSATNTSQCPGGYESQGPTCVPILDDCPGHAEIPVLGGGCRSVGVTACATGLFEPDGEGGCEPILPPGSDSCPPGTMEMLGHPECQPVGVTECAVGFASDEAGGCDAILPSGPDPCPPGTIALLGHTECQPLGDCGGPSAGPWGNIVDDPTTVYVDQTADATGADGTAQAPYETIAEALAVVLPGGQIAIAAGDYTERLSISQPLRLTGRCPELVTIRGRWWANSAHPPITINLGGTGSTINGVTLTGPGEGLVISGAQQVVVSQTQVRDASDMGIVAEGSAEVVLQQVVVAGCTDLGVYSIDSTLRLDTCVIRDTQPQPDTGWYGKGVYASCSTAELCGSVQVYSSLLSTNREFGIDVVGADAEIIATVVRDTMSAQSDGWYGRGIAATCFPGADICGSLYVSSSLVSGNREMGIGTAGMDTEVIATVVRDTLSELGTGLYGRGINTQCSLAGICGSLRVSASLVSGNHETGIYSIGGDGEITDSIVRNNLSDGSAENFGVGIGARCDVVAGICGSLRVSSCLVADNQETGIFAAGVNLEVTTTVARDTLSHESSGTEGMGICAQCDQQVGVCGSLRVSSCLVSGNQGMGINISGVDTEITATVVSDTQPHQISGKLGRGIGTRCDQEIGSCPSLLISETLVKSNENVGIFIAGTTATLNNVAVINTRSNADGLFQDIHGQGIWALCDLFTGDCGSLSMTSCLVDSSQGAGLALKGVSGFMTSSVVRSVLSQVLDGKYGYGVQIGGLEGQPGHEMPTFDITDCEIRNASLAGILYFRARGTLSGSVVSGAENSVVMNEGSEVTILDNNVLSGTIIDEPTWANLYPSPAPPPTLPVESNP